jgi:hypothetical protein
VVGPQNPGGRERDVLVSRDDDSSGGDEEGKVNSNNLFTLHTLLDRFAG